MHLLLRIITMKQKKKLVIVDPIFRASRLFFTYIASIGAINRDYKVYIITRKDYQNPQYRELFLDLDVDFIPIIDAVKDKWYFKVPIKEIRKALIYVRKNFNLRSNTMLYIPGWNEFFPWLPLMLLFRFKGLHEYKIRGIEYDINFLLDGRQSFKSIIKLVIFYLLSLKFKNTLIGVLDERITYSASRGLRKRTKKRIFLIADPANSKLFINEINEPSADRLINILIVGLQSKRKGLDDVINLLKQTSNELNNVRFKLVGRLDADTEIFRGTLNADKRIDFKDGFMSEAEIIKEYMKSDFVIIPYKKSFHSSSGVYAYAILAGKPVISTKHGCIGYRVNHFNLGFTYESGNISELSTVISNLPPMSSEVYVKLSIRSKNYAKRNSIISHNKILFEDDK